MLSHILCSLHIGSTIQFFSRLTSAVDWIPRFWMHASYLIDRHLCYDYKRKLRLKLEDVEFQGWFPKQYNISDILNHFEITSLGFFSLPQFNISIFIYLNVAQNCTLLSWVEFDPLFSSYSYCIENFESPVSTHGHPLVLKKMKKWYGFTKRF